MYPPFFLEAPTSNFNPNLSRSRLYLPCPKGLREDIGSIGATLHVLFFRRRFQSLRFQVSSFKFQVSSFRFQVSSFKFQVSGFKFQVSGFRFQVSSFRFQVSKFQSFQICVNLCEFVVKPIETAIDNVCHSVGIA